MVNFIIPKNKLNLALLFKYLLFLGLFFVIIFPTKIIQAVDFDKNAYTEGENITVSNITGFLVLYNFDSDYYVYEGGDIYYDWDPNTFQLPAGRYSLMEFGAFEYCRGVPYSYEECKSQPDLINEILFTINPTPEVGDPIRQSVSFPPEVEIILPRYSNKIFAGKIPVEYNAIDRNDADLKTKAQLGLIDNPVSVFYSDKFIGSSQMLVADEDKKFIASDLPAKGIYEFITNDLLENKFYRIIVSAKDKMGIVGEAVSDLFSVDHTSPTFIVTASPAVVKTEDVTIRVSASEELADIPKVSVRQRGALPQDLKMLELRGEYVGVYKVVKGFDGTAKVEVSGVDISGNEGDLVVGGGTFSVGINPPIKPIVSYPLDHENILSDVFDLKGSGRDDTQISVLVNGIDVYTSEPDKEGNFVVKNIRLNKKSANGANTLNIVAKDLNGNTSEAVVIRILSNVAPKIKLLSPSQNDLLSGKNIIRVEASDDNNDKIHFLYQVAPIKKTAVLESDWKTIEDVPNDQIIFDTTKFLDGEYFLRVTADDGVSASFTNINNIRIKNETSFYIRFYDGLRTIVKTNSALVRGIVFADKNSKNRPVVKSLEYSLDKGVSWVSVSSEDGAFNSEEERFAVNISNLKDGVNDVIWKTEDSRGTIVSSVQPILVDRESPLPPVVVYPLSSKVLGSEDNERSVNGKFSFTLKGKAEAGSVVSLEINNQKYTGRTFFDGTFRIDKIVLPNIGKYHMKITATDEAQNVSSVFEQDILYNNLPKIILTNPREGKGVGVSTNISWILNDLDGGTLSGIKLSYRKGKAPFVVLADNLKDKKFLWDTSGLAEGSGYELRLESNDQFSNVNSTVHFSIDHTNPVLSDLVLDTNVFGKGGLLKASGNAYDLDSGVEFIEYSFLPVDASDPESLSIYNVWYKADIDKKYFGNKISFKLKQNISLPDGDYKFRIRAIDMAGNISEEKTENISIDYTPPRAGSFELLSDGVRVLPVDGLWTIIAGADLDILVSLEPNTSSAYISYQNEKIDLKKDLSRGLWRGKLNFEQIGNYEILIGATDVLGNTSSGKLVTFSVAKKGVVYSDLTDGSKYNIEGAKIKAKSLIKDKSIMSIFRSPDVFITTTDENGGYTLYLPAGKFQISIEKEGFETLYLDDFYQDSPSLFNKDIILNAEEVKPSLWNKLLRML